MVDLALWATGCLTILIIVTDEDCGSLCQWLPDHQNHPHHCALNFVQLQSIDNLQIDYRLQKQMLCYNMTIHVVFYLHPGFHLGPPLSLPTSRCSRKPTFVTGTLLDLSPDPRELSTERNLYPSLEIYDFSCHIISFRFNC